MGSGIVSGHCGSVSDNVLGTKLWALLRRWDFNHEFWEPENRKLLK